MRESPPAFLRLAPRNGAGVAALATGIAALVLVLTVVLFPLGGLLGLVAMLLGVVGNARVARWKAFNRGQAISGLLCGALAVLLAAALAARVDGRVAERARELARLDRCLLTAGSSGAAATCGRTFASQLATQRVSEVSGGAGQGMVLGGPVRLVWGLAPAVL
jgi:hypothetical protein